VLLTGRECRLRGIHLHSTDLGTHRFLERLVE
jgi:hypothetical protein